MADNATRKILADHLVEGDLRPGEPIALRVDQTLLQDATGTMACMQFEQLGVPRVRVDWRASTGSTTRGPATGSPTTSRSSASPSPARSWSEPTPTPPPAEPSG